MSDLVAFLEARLDEDEAAVHAYARGEAVPLTLPVALHRTMGAGRGYDKIAARVLREVEAKRRIVAEYERAHTRPKGDVASAGALLALHGVVKHLASAYSDHPDYRREWQPL